MPTIATSGKITTPLADAHHAREYNNSHEDPGCNTEKELPTNPSLGDASYDKKDNFVVYNLYFLMSASCVKTAT